MQPPEIDMALLASEWLRVLRGTRSQVAFSRRLGYQSNIAYRWESGRCSPRATQFLRILNTFGGKVADGLVGFYRSTPPWLAEVDPCSADGVAQLLDDLRGKTTLVELARRSGFSRFAVNRWLRGRAEPTMVEFLTLIEHMTRRGLDFVASFTNPELLPSVAAAWHLLALARRAAYDQPWSHAVLRAVELADYRSLPAHHESWIASRLGIDLALERECLDVLQKSQQIHFDGRHYVPTKIQSVDTRQDRKRALELRAGWATVSVERMRNGAQGLLAYNLSAISRADLTRIEQLQRAHYRELVNIIAESAPAECVVLYSAQLLELRGVQNGTGT